MKILITGGKTATALKLVKAFNDVEVVLGDYGEVPSIKTSSYRFESLGEWNEEVLAHNLLTKCLDFGVDKLLPLYEHEIAALTKSLVLFEEFGLQVLLPEPSQLEKNQIGAAVKHWGIFEDGKSIYHNLLDEAIMLNAKLIKLNGAYHYDSEMGDFVLIAIPNPSLI